MINSSIKAIPSTYASQTSSTELDQFISNNFNPFKTKIESSISQHEHTLNELRQSQKELQEAHGKSESHKQDLVDDINTHRSLFVNLIEQMGKRTDNNNNKLASSIMNINKHQISATKQTNSILQLLSAPVQNIPPPSSFTINLDPTVPLDLDTHQLKSTSDDDKSSTSNSSMSSNNFKQKSNPSLKDGSNNND